MRHPSVLFAISAFVVLLATCLRHAGSAELRAESDVFHLGLCLTSSTALGACLGMLLGLASGTTRMMPWAVGAGLLSASMGLSIMLAAH